MLSFYRFDSPGLPMEIDIYDRPEAEEVREDPGWDLGVWRRTNCQSSGFGINPIARYKKFRSLDVGFLRAR
jgi:hypothetical protein